MIDNFRLLLRHNIIYFFVAIATVLLKKPHNIILVGHGTLQDPDSYMRLVRIQEALDQGHWFGDAVSRDASGFGIVIHWSHLLDGIILMLRSVLKLMLPPDEALLWAGVITSILSVGLLGAVCAWAVAPLAKRGWLWIAPLGVAAAAPVVAYAQFGTVTHHVFLFALAAATWGAGGRAAFGSVRWGSMAGVFAGVGIWLSPEAMPFGLMAFGAILLSWATRPAPTVALASAACGSAFLATIAFELLVDPPHSGRAAPQLDRLSVVFLCLAAIVCAVSWLPRMLTSIRLSISARFAIAVLASMGGAMLWLMLFPGYLSGLTGLMTPEEASAFFPSIQEMQPINTASLFAACALPGILAVIAAFGYAIWQREILPSLLWVYAGLCASVCVTLSLVHVKFSSYAVAGAAMVLPVLLSHAGASMPKPWCRLVRPGLVAAFLCVPSVLALMLLSRTEVEAARATSTYQAQCSMQTLTQMLAPHPGAVVLANVDDGPELLYRTRVKIIGSLYHSGIHGFMRLKAAWAATDLDHVPDELRATGAHYVVLCPGILPKNMASGHRATLFERLDGRDPPVWLHPVPGEPDSGWTLYEVERP